MRVWYTRAMKILAMVFLALTCALAQAGPHVVFVLGEKEYKTMETVPAFFESALKPAGYTATFITAPPEGEATNDFSGLAEALAEADLCFLSVRRRAPAKEDMQALKRFVADGKPIVAIRTSSHAFHLKDQPVPEGHEVWEAFDPAILGGNYHGHYREQMAEISVAEGAADHGILKGVGPLRSSDKLYQSRPLAAGTKLLLAGKIDGEVAEPVAWTNAVGENQAKIFYTSLGQDTDFADVAFQKLLKNAIDWAVLD
jgi:type 1 glutamine amidotransferase